MDRADRFRQLFKVGGGSLDPAGIPALMRFGGFTEKDSYLVEAAVRLSPEAFRIAFSDPDDERARDAAESIEVPGIAPIVSDMRRALGLRPLRTIVKGTDRRRMFADMFDELGYGSLVDGSMSRRGFLPEDVLMVEYMVKCCRRELSRMVKSPEPEVAEHAADAIAEKTSLDKVAVLALMEDMRGEEKREAPIVVDPDLVFKKSRPSEARVVRYKGSAGRVDVPREAVVDGVRLRVTSVSDNAFARNTDLVEVSLPEGVRSIGRYAFYGCTALTSAKLPEGLKTIGPGAFCRCSSLESVDLPQGLESIEDQAFLGCPMEEVFLPESVTRVGPHSFPSGTKRMGRNA